MADETRRVASLGFDINIAILAFGLEATGVLDEVVPHQALLDVRSLFGSLIVNWSWHFEVVVVIVKIVAEDIFALVLLLGLDLGVVRLQAAVQGGVGPEQMPGHTGGVSALRLDNQVAGSTLGRLLVDDLEERPDFGALEALVQLFLGDLALLDDVGHLGVEPADMPPHTGRVAVLRLDVGLALVAPGRVLVELLKVAPHFRLAHLRFLFAFENRLLVVVIVLVKAGPTTATLIVAKHQGGVGVLGDLSLDHVFPILAVRDMLLLRKLDGLVRSTPEVEEGDLRIKVSHFCASQIDLLEHFTKDITANVGNTDHGVLLQTWQGGKDPPEKRAQQGQSDTMGLNLDAVLAEQCQICELLLEPQLFEAFDQGEGWDRELSRRARRQRLGHCCEFHVRLISTTFDIFIRFTSCL